MGNTICYRWSNCIDCASWSTCADHAWILLHVWGQEERFQRHFAQSTYQWPFFLDTSLNCCCGLSIISQICCSANVREAACTSTNSRRLSFFLIQRGNDTSEAKHCEPAHKASICDQHWGMDKAATILIVRYIFSWNPLNCFSIPILMFVLMFLLLYESFAFDRLLICRDTLIIP